MALGPIREEIFLWYQATSAAPMVRLEDRNTSETATSTVDDPDVTVHPSVPTATVPSPKDNKHHQPSSNHRRHKGKVIRHIRTSRSILHTHSSARNVTTRMKHEPTVPLPPNEEEHAGKRPPSANDELQKTFIDEPTTTGDNSEKSGRRKKKKKTKTFKLVRRGAPRRKVYASPTNAQQRQRPRTVRAARHTGPPKPARMPTPAPTSRPDPVALSCCLHAVSVEDLMRQYTPKYFNLNFFVDDQYKRRDNWNAVAPHKINGNTCTDYWTRLTLQQTRGGYYFGAVLNELVGNENTTIFPFFEEAPHSESVVPRALFLGDSVSRGAWERLLSLYSHRGIHLAGAPANCYGFEQYKKHDSLLHWLGPCKWDFVQFNIGLHFHPKPNGDWREEYQQGLRDIVQTIHEHSPSAKIVIALTTPSPLDTDATYPRDDGSCPHLAKFHKTGFISSLNDVVQSMLEGNETIPGLWGFNDRYSLMTPHLIDYQLPCDVHYTATGYERLAEQDWKTVVTALNLDTMASRFW